LTTTDVRIDIAETVYGFAYGIDRRDWSEYRRIFVAPPADIEFDYESYHGRPATRMSVDDWVAAVTPLFSGLDATQHTMSNPVVEVDGGSARCRVYMQARRGNEAIMALARGAAGEQVRGGQTT
jgi:hypothetical protein